MTNAEIIQAFREEIERRIDAHHTHGHFCAEHEFRDVLSFISYLEKSLPSKVADGEVLEEEINRTYHDGSVADTSDIDHVTYENIAEHFYDLGCRRTAEKYDESEKPTNMELKDEIDKSINSLDGCFTKINGVPEYHLVTDEELRKFASHFAEWQKKQDEEEQADLFTIVALDAAQRAKEQMMQGALNGWLDEDNEPPYDLNVVCEEKIPFGKFKHGDKVKLIIIKEE